MARMITPESPLAPFLSDTEILTPEDLQRVHYLSGYEIVELQQRGVRSGMWCAAGLFIVVTLLVWFFRWITGW